MNPSSNIAQSMPYPYMNPSGSVGGGPATELQMQMMMKLFDEIK